MESLRAANQPVEREQPLSRENGRRVLREHLRPADLLWKQWVGGKDVAVDVTVCHPLQRAELPWSVAKCNTFLKRKEEAKIVKYADPCALEGWDFLPMAFTTWGSSGPQAFPLLRKIFRRAAMGADADTRPKVIADLHNKLSVALFRQMVSLLQPILLV